MLCPMTTAECATLGEGTEPLESNPAAHIAECTVARIESFRCQLISAFIPAPQAQGSTILCLCELGEALVSCARSCLINLSSHSIYRDGAVCLLTEMANLQLAMQAPSKRDLRVHLGSELSML